MRKSINKIVLIILFSTVCNGLFAQADTLSDLGQADIVNGTCGMTDPADRMIAINDLLKSGRITNETYIAELYVNLAETTGEINAEVLRKCYYELPITDECKAIFNLINAYYKKAFDTCEFCAPKNILSRYKLLKNYLYFEERAEKDIALLKSYGYREEIQSIPLGFSYTKTPLSDFIGFELSVFSVFAPRYKMKNLNKKTGKIEVADENQVSMNYQNLSCGFNHDIRRRGNEIWFSLGQITSPVFFNPLKFGRTENFDPNEKAHWFYRPGIGLGWGFFSLNCDYNMVLKKSFRKSDNGLCLTVRLCFPWVRLN